MKKRTLALLMVAIMLFGVAVGGTVAWLTTESSTVTNTFTVGDINIVLNEADVNITDDDGNVTYEEFVRNNEAVGKLEDADRVQANEYELIPGADYFKDPKVTVLIGSEPCYVYVKVTETNNDDDTIIFTINTDNWKLVSGYTDLYRYNTKLDAASEAKQTESVIKDSQISIREDLTKDVMHPTTGTYAKPQLDFVAAAVQSENISQAVADKEAAKLLKATALTTP